MAIGPVQLIVLGFSHPEFHGEIIAELERLKESDTVRVIDALAVHKDADGEMEVQHLSNLSKDEAIEFGSKVGALIGLGIEGEEGMVAGAEAGAEAGADGISVFTDEEAWDVLEDIPNDSAAALILLEHHWAVPLRDAIARAGGFRLSDGFISPLDLVAIGLVTAEEAAELHAAETSVSPPEALFSQSQTIGAIDVRIPQSRPAHLAPRRTPPLDGSPRAFRSSSPVALNARRRGATAAVTTIGAIAAGDRRRIQPTTGTDFEGALGWNGRISSWSRPMIPQVASGTSFQTPATSPSGSDTISRASSESSWSSCRSG